MKNSVMIVLCFAIAAAIGLTGFIYLMMQRKFKKQEADFYHQLQNLRYELNTKTNAIDLAAYYKEEGTENSIYDSRMRNMQEDFDGQGAGDWDYTGHQFSDEAGRGWHQIKDGIITLERTNTAGRYELHLKHYGYPNSADKIPADTTTDVRKLRLTCQVKRSNTSHGLRFVFKGETTQTVLDEKDYVVFNPDWEKVNLVFTISAKEACTLRIDDLYVQQSPDNIQIKNIVLYEKR